MPDSLSDLEARRAELSREIAALGDLRRGSITGTGGRCGKPSCYCHQKDSPGHAPHFRMTCKAAGRSITESFSTPAAQRKAEREIAAFRRYEELNKAFLEVNEAICRLRPVGDTMTPQEKKRQTRSMPKSRAK